MGRVLAVLMLLADFQCGIQVPGLLLLFPLMTLAWQGQVRAATKDSVEAALLLALGLAGK